MWACDLPLVQEIGLDRVGGMPLAGVRLTIHRLNAHARHQGGYMPPPNRMAFSPEQIAQHPGTGKRMVQMEFVDPTHPCQVRGRHRRRRGGRGRPREHQKLALPNNWQGVSSVDQRFALSNPALVSAPSKKSFSNANCPILAWRILRSGASGL